MNYSQDLFWVNMPRSRKLFTTRLGFLKSNLGDKSFLTGIKTPCYIYTGTNYIRKLEKLKLSEKIKNKLNKTGLHIYLYEPSCFKLGDYHNRSFYSEFKHTVNLKELTADELDSVNLFINNNNLTNITVFTSDYNIQLVQSNYPNLKLHCLDTFLRDMIYDNKMDLLTNSINKKFWCGNWRYTPHRHLVTAYMIKLNGNYSWNLSCNFEKLKENVWFDLDKLKIEDTHRYQQIKDGVEYLENHVVAIDQSLEAVNVDSSEEVYIPGDNSPSHSNLFRQSYKECFCAVVNETRYAQPYGYFSEKTLTPINAMVPIILVAPPKTLEYLKTFGFKTFDRWWDESYDQEQDHEKRLLKIFDIIDYINNKSFDELRKMYNEMIDILLHNKEILKKLPYNSTVL